MGNNKKKKFQQGRKKPVGRAGHLLTSWGDTMYIGGGYAETGPLSDFWQFQKGQEWKSIKISTNASPFPRMMCDGCQFGDEIYLFGGIQQFGEEVLIQNDLWKFDINTKCWIQLQSESPISERYNHVAVSISSHQMLIHGGECNGLFGDCWIYDIISRNFTQIPTPVDRSPCPRSSHSCTFIYPYVVIFGGVTNSALYGDVNNTTNGVDSTSENVPVYLNDLWLLDTSTSENPALWTWRMLSFEGLAPSPRDMASLLDISEYTQRSHSVLLFGGYGLSETETINESEDDNDNDNENDEEPENTKEDRSICLSNEESLNEGPSSTEDQTNDDTSNDLSQAIQSQLTIVESSETIQTPPTANNDNNNTINTNNDTNQVKEDDNDDDQSVCETYLNDAWIINLQNGQAEEVELRSTIEKNNQQYFSSGSGWRGSRFVILRSVGPEHSLELSCFGGFNGQEFADHIPSLSINTSLPRP